MPQMLCVVSSARSTTRPAFEVAAEPVAITRKRPLRPAHETPRTSSSLTTTDNPTMQASLGLTASVTASCVNGRSDASMPQTRTGNFKGRRDPETSNSVGIVLHYLYEF